MANITEIDTALREFGQSLKPNDDDLDAGTKKAQMVFELLQSKSKFALARQIFGGSIGKATAIPPTYDFDLVILVNNISPPYDKVLEDFEHILLNCKENILSVHKTRHSVQFKIDGFEYDLLPGVNFVTGPNRPGDWTVKEQRSRVLQKIKEDPRKAYTYSSSLVESQLDFMKKQSAFIHELARLCKSWNKTIPHDYISGRSTIIELIATHAGKKEEENSDVSMFRAFKGFLELIKDIENLEIIFDGIKPEIPVIKPFLLEPANPFNNLLESLKPSAKSIFRKHAIESLARLEEFCNKPSLDHFPLEVFFGKKEPVGLVNPSGDMSSLMNQLSFEGASRSKVKAPNSDKEDTNGCQHYRRKCKIMCPTCQKLYSCRFCHDEAVKGHKLDRFKVKFISCTKCHEFQGVSNSCLDCKIQFAKYYCKTCCLFVDDADSVTLLWHCDKCGICRKKERVGMDYVHCDSCCMCCPAGLNQFNHQCKSNAGKLNCLVCKDEIFGSRKPAVLARCGHYVHVTCKPEFPSEQTKCGICGVW